MFCTFSYFKKKEEEKKIEISNWNDYVLDKISHAWNSFSSQIESENKKKNKNLFLSHLDCE